MPLRAIARIAGALAVAAALSAAPPGASAQSGADPVAARQAAMKQLGAHNRAIAGFLKGAGTAEDAARRGKAIAAAADAIPGLFPEGTGLDALGLGKTGARPEIWAEWDRFRAVAGAMKEHALALAAAAEAGDRDGVKAAMASVGRMGCAGCHRAFRQKRPRN